MSDSTLPVEDSLVSTPQGKLLGQVEDVPRNIHAFKGIPYALPPVGKRRWAPPEPTRQWTGMRLAKAYAPQAMQATIPDSFGVPIPQNSEDCLYLNVWTPAQKDAEASFENARLPVMVWIHGGARRWGSGELNGVPLASKGVVLVSMNYRVGLFGYLAHPELTEESVNSSSGNYAILDQIEALKWVQNNIAAFGGDPDNVTLFGNSSGTASIHALVASPLAKGLFHKVIAQSGSLFYPCRGLSKPLFGARTGEELGVEFAKSAGVTHLTELRELPADELIRIADSADDGNFYKHLDEVVDGWVLPDQPLEITRRGHHNKVPVMAGFTANDGGVVSLLGYAPPLPESPEAYQAEIHKRYGDLAEQFLAVYPSSDLIESYFNVLRDRAFAWASESWCKYTAQSAMPAYLYCFSHIPPDGHLTSTVPGSNYQRQNGAGHGSEIPYILNDPQSHPLSNQYPPTDQDRRMADIMSDYWVAFAKWGEPAVEHLPEWKPYTDQGKNYMKFENAQAHPARDLFPGMWELLNEDLKRRLTLPGVGRDYYAVGIASPILPYS